MNNSFVGDYYTWELNNNGELTVNGNMAEVVLFNAGRPGPSYLGPMKVDENGIEFDMRLRSNFEPSVTLMKSKIFRFDPNHITITISKHNGTNWVDFTYSEGDQQRTIYLSAYWHLGSEMKKRTKDFCKIFPAIVDTAKTLTHEKAQKNQRMMEATTQAQQQQKVMIERGALEKLKKLVKVSTKLKISQMAQILKMSESDLYDRIVDWASDYGFKLDEDIVMFSSGRKDDFIASLDTAFANWDKKTETKEGKLE